LEKSNAKLTLAEQTRDANARVRNIIIAVALLLVVVLVLLLLVYRKTVRLNAQLKKRESELQKSNNVKDRLFSVIGHDLKAPMAHIPPVLQLLNDASINAEERQYMIDTLAAHSRASMETLDKLLFWGKTQIKGIGINQSNFATDGHINNNIELSKSAAESKQITIINNTPADTFVRADSSHFDFIVRNLLSNAIKFTNNGGSVTINAETTSKPGFVVFSISDTGTGISNERLANIFEPFVNSTRGTADEKGTGIGLMLCKEFVEENGGAIWVETREGRGATFYFSLKKGSV
jgi:signal transduction histidine kinase